MKLSLLYGVAAFMLFSWTGCQKQNPVQLLDDGLQSQGLEVQNAKITVEPFDTSVQNSSEFFLTSEKKYYGRLLINGSEYDSPTEHHEASLAQAVFFERSEPVLFNGDTVGFKAVDAGTISIDNLSLRVAPERLSLPDIPIDSIGVRYSLLNVDGTGGKGFTYFGTHAYHWDIGGTASVTSFQATIAAPAKIHVTSPVSGDNVSLSVNLIVRWNGGGDVVSILISDPRVGRTPKPLLRLKLRENNGHVVIPSRVLQLLPQDRSRLLFTVSSEYSFVAHPGGFEDDVIVRAITSHSLVFHVTH